MAIFDWEWERSSAPRKGRKFPVKFSPKSKTKDLGMLFSIWKVFAQVWIGKGPKFISKLSIGKSH